MKLLYRYPTSLYDLCAYLQPMEWDTLQVSDSAPVDHVSGTGIKMQP